LAAVKKRLSHTDRLIQDRDQSLSFWFATESIPRSPQRVARQSL